MKRVRADFSWIAVLFCCVLLVTSGCIKKAEVVTSEIIEPKGVPIELMDKKYNEFNYSGNGYVISSFGAFFSVKNTSNEHIQYRLRIPIYLEENKGVESFFSFIDAEGKELVLELKGNEERALALTLKDYDVVGYLGESEVGLMEGKVGQIVVDYGEGFVPVESKSAITFGLGQEELTERMLTYSPMELLKLRELNLENLSLREEVSLLESRITELNINVTGTTNNPEGKVFEKLIQDSYSVFKYQDSSGLKKYNGITGTRIYPSMEAPYIHLMFDEKSNPDDRIVNCIAVVYAEGQDWGMVVNNNYGDMKIGFIPYNELEDYEEPEHESTVESIGGFELGDRIEKLIGTIDREYEVISENLCIYIFPDEAYSSDDPMQNVFSGIKTLDAFVSNEFRAWLIRTDSPQYVLRSGFRVGDRALEVLDYYRSRYQEVITNDEYMYMDFATGTYKFKLSETEEISFNIDSDSLTEESIITSIYLY